MTPEQLAAARATQWRQDAQPLLTLEDASSWLERMQLALYLPRKAHVLAPAPSFVEAVSGAGSATPAPDAIAQAHALLVRLVAEGSVVPLNLFGTPGEQPDFLVATQALPHLAALQGDRNWKKPPSRTGPGKVSPLAIEIWKLLDSDHGVLTANEIRSQLGHELTEAATIRGLSELWQNLRVAPFPQADGEPAHWQILSVTHKKEMAAGGTMSQSAALSMLVSNYLQSIVTGTAEDIEAFLSPVASRSRLRDVIRGLTATRQLRTLSMDAQTFFFIEGTLPDMPEMVVVSAEAAEAKPAFMGRSAYRERMLNRGKEDEEKPAENAGDAQRRTPFRPSSDRPGYDRAGSDRSSAPRRFAAGSGSGTFRKRPAGGGARDSRSSGHSSAGQFSAPRRSYGANQGGFDRDNAGRPPFRRSEGGDSGSRPSFSRPRPEGAGSDRPFTPRTGASRPPYGSRPAFGRDRSGPPRPFTPRAEGDRPSFKPRSDYGASSGKPGGYSKDRGRPSFGSGRSSEGGARPFRPRPEGDRPRSGTGRPFTPREGGRPAFSDRAKPFSGGAKPYGDRPKPYSDRPKPYSDRPRPSFEKDSDASGKNSSRAGFMSRAGSRPGRPTGDRPRPDRAPGDRPSAGRPRPARAGGDRPYAPRPSDGRPSSGPRSFTPRPSGDRGKPGEGHLPPKFDAKPSYQRRDSASPRGSDGSRRSDGPRSDSRPPRREGGSSGYPSNPNRPSRAPKAGGSFLKRDGDRPSSARPSGARPASGRPASGSGGRPPARSGKPGFSSRPPSRGAASPGRNPGGTGRPSGPRVGGGRPSSGRPSSGRPGGSSRPGSSRPGASKPGGMKPPTRKPRPEKDSE